MAKNPDHFLELLSESEATAAGYNLSEKNNFTVYQTIKKLSSVAHAKSDSLFTHSGNHPSPIRLDHSIISRILKNLVNTKIIAQAIHLEYKRIEGKDLLVKKPCYFAKSDLEENAPHKIFEQTIHSNTLALQNYFLSLGEPNLKDFWKELECDLNATPPAKTSMLDLTQLINAREFEIIPSYELVSYTLEKIHEAILDNELVYSIPPFGILVVPGKSVVSIYELAELFLIDKLIPKYIKEGTLRSALEEIAQEEAIYCIDEDAPRTTQYTNKRVERILETIKKTKEKNDTKETLKGELTFQIIRVLSGMTEKIYHKNWQLKIDELLQEIQTPLYDTSAWWKNQILWLTRDQELKINKVVMEKLRSTPDILSGEWENRDTSMTFFIRKDREFMKTLIYELNSLPDRENWRILAIRQLIEDHDEYFSPLFKNKEFRKNYGKLLRKVYINNIPFFYKLLMMMGITLFQDKSFALAKEKIHLQQNTFRTKNLDRHYINLRNIERIRLAKIDKINNLGTINKIKNKLSQFYFTRKKIPTISELQASLPSLNIENWPAYLKSHGFQIIRFRNFEKNQAAIICFPVDSEWTANKREIDKLLDELLENKNDQSDDLSQSTMIRAERLKKFMTTPVAAKKSYQGQIDSYAILEKEIKKQKQKELQMSGLSGIDDGEF